MVSFVWIFLFGFMTVLGYGFVWIFGFTTALGHGFVLKFTLAWRGGICVCMDSIQTHKEEDSTLSRNVYVGCTGPEPEQWL